MLSTAMVALGTTLSAFWIMANNSWMQVPVGYAMENGQFVPNDWFKIMFSQVLWVRFRTCSLQPISPVRFALPRPERGIYCAGSFPPRLVLCSGWGCIWLRCCFPSSTLPPRMPTELTQAMPVANAGPVRNTEGNGKRCAFEA